MKYFQTDDRDDYFATLKPETIKDYVIEKDGKEIYRCRELKAVKTFLNKNSATQINWHMKSAYDIAKTMSFELKKSKVIK